MNELSLDVAIKICTDAEECAHRSISSCVRCSLIKLKYLQHLAAGDIAPK